jgi:Tfp pilus assembly pilus retraction ATPase PilT
MSLREDQTRFFGKLAALMEAEIPLLNAFEVAAEGVVSASFRGSLERILSRAYGGMSLTDAIEKEGEIFSPEIMCLLRHGEATGDLELKSAAIARGLSEGVFESGSVPEGEEGDLLDVLVDEASEAGASDVHLEPMPGGATLRFRVEGRLDSVREINHAEAGVLLVLAKRKAGLDPSVVGLPQEGRFDVEDGEIRASTCPYADGEGLVLRFLPEREPPRLADVGLGEVAEGWLAAPSGLVLVAAPPGHGRRTAIEAMLAKLDRTERKVMLVDRHQTIRMPGLLPVALDEEDDFEPADAVVAALHQDLDAVAIPDLEDTDTLDQALRAVLTGHLVILGLDAGDTHSAIEMLLSSGADPDTLAATLLGATAHRRLTRADGQGRVTIGETLHVLPEVRKALREDAELHAPAPSLVTNVERLLKEGVVTEEEAERVVG